MRAYAIPDYGMSDAGMWALTFVIVAGAVTAFCGVSYVINLLQSRQVREVREARKALAVRQVQVDAAHAQLMLLCGQARDHLAVLEAFREGFQLFADDVEIGEARSLYNAAVAAHAESVAEGGAHTRTTALPTVRPVVR